MLPEVGEVAVALWIEWGLLVACWRSGGCFWRVRLGLWRLWVKFAGGVDFGQKWPQVFVVLDVVCEGNWR